LSSAVEVGVTAEDKQRDAIEALMIERGGQSELVRQGARMTNAAGYTGSPQSKVTPTVDPGHLRQESLFEIARRMVRKQHGPRVDRMSRMEVAGLALRAGSNATGDFSVLLASAMNKVLLSAYAVQGLVWRRLAGVASVPDFRSNPRYRSGAFGDVLQVVPEGAEYPRVQLPDGSVVNISTRTKGGIASVTRQALINDDLGAVADQMKALGETAAKAIEKEVFALFAANSGFGPTMSDSHPFFYSGRSNIGTGSAISAAALDADKVVMRSQLNPSGDDHLDVSPYVLLVPLTLETTANTINASAFDPTSGAGAQVPNPAKGIFTDIVGSPRLSGTRRYLLANPATNPAFVVAFLEESGQAPYIETRDGFEVDGMDLKVRIDFMAQAFDPQMAITNAGV
jgi:hypothetical protein